MARDRAAPRRHARRTTCTRSPGRSSCTASSATLATDYWRTPRYATGRYPVPQIGNGHNRHPITAQRDPASPTATRSSTSSSSRSREIKPDLSLELRIDAAEARPSTCSSSSTSPAAPPTTTTSSSPTTPSSPAGASPTRATETQGTRPVVVFVCPDPRAALACAREADAALTGRIGAMGTPRRALVLRRPRPHSSSPSSPTSTTAPCRRSRCPPLPPGLRERLTGSRELRLTRVALLPGKLVRR